MGPMHAAFFVALLLPSLVRGDDPQVVYEPDDSPQTDAQLAERLCGAFMQHPRLSDKPTNCFSHIEDGDLDIYGRGVTEQDLVDLCTSVRAKPAPGGNIAMTAHNEDGSTVALRCSVNGRLIRRVPIDDSKVSH
jgi:hypothetical protein